MSKKINELTIWDFTELPKKTKNVWLWSKRSKDYNSIINLIDNNSKKIKKSVLNLFNEFSQSKIEKSKLVDYYKFENNFSYWNISFFVEKNFYRQNLFDVLKICALKDLILKKNYNCIKLNTSNKLLVKFFENYANSKKIDLKINFKNIPRQNFLISKLKNILRIIIFIHKRINFKKNNIRHKNIFFSYFENIDHKFEKSIYWSNLFNKFKNNEIIQIFIPSKKFSNIRKIQKKNLTLLDYEFNLFLFFKIIYSFFKISFLNKKVQLFGNKIFSNNFVNYWPIIKPYWEESFKSINLFKNLYYYYLIKNIVLKKLSPHNKLFYLFENQPWERSLCFYYKKKFSKKKIIGISHTPIRFWDLRFFNSKKNNLSKYSPDKISFVNSYSQKIYKKDYKNQVFIKLEALRYNNLKINFNNKKKEKILIIGDYLDSENLNIRSLIAKSTLNKYDFLYLPHPSNKKVIYENFTFLKSKNELKFYNISKVIIPHISTSIIEYILNYKDVLVILNDNMPNMNTLFMSSHNVKYVYDIDDLNKKIAEKKHNLHYKYSDFKPFGTNKKLTFWKKILSNDFKK